MSKEERIGTLIVVVLKAKNLIDRHSFYKQDVFCQISLNGARSVRGNGTEGELTSSQVPISVRRWM